MLRRRVTLSVFILLIVFLMMLFWGWFVYCRGKAEGYFYCLESLSVLREFTPSIAEMSVDKQTMINKLDKTMEMQEFFTLEEYLEIPATFRLGMETRSCADMTVAEKIKVYRQWLRSKNCVLEGVEP